MYQHKQTLVASKNCLPMCFRMQRSQMRTSDWQRLWIQLFKACLVQSTERKHQLAWAWGRDTKSIKLEVETIGCESAMKWNRSRLMFNEAQRSLKEIQSLKRVYTRKQYGIYCAEIWRCFNTKWKLVKTSLTPTSLVVRFAKYCSREERKYPAFFNPAVFIDKCKSCRFGCMNKQNCLKWVQNVCKMCKHLCINHSLSCVCAPCQRTKQLRLPFSETENVTRVSYKLMRCSWGFIIVLGYLQITSLQKDGAVPHFAVIIRQYLEQSIQTVGGEKE